MKNKIYHPVLLSSICFYSTFLNAQNYHLMSQELKNQLDFNKIKGLKSWNGIEKNILISKFTIIMNRLLLLLTMIYLSNNCISQQQISTDPINLIDKYSVNWMTYFENEQVKIEYKFSECDPEMGYDFEQVILRFVNKSTKKMDIDWHIHLYYDEKCLTCNYPVEYARTIRLLPNETLEGNCDRETINELKLFSKFIDVNYSKGAILTSFQLASLNIAFPQ